MRHNPMPPDTRTAILDAAQELIQRLGANGMSYQHISDVVGIRKASIHHHFQTKDRLIEELVGRYSRYFLGLVDDILACDATPSAKLRRYAELFHATLCQGHQDKACLCGMLGAELTTLGSSAAEAVRLFYRENESRLAQILDEGRRTGDFTFPGEVKTMAVMIFSLLEGGALIVRADGGPRRFRAITEQLMKLLAK
jgi:TetR/AcrR family transcriptional regulator, transcriptional repressor for nem operon